MSSRRCAFDRNSGRTGMVMRALAAIAIAAPFLICHSATAATQQDFDDCSQSVDVARSAAACSRIIASPDASAADRAAALIQLGNDDAASGKLDEAIADYSGAIQLDPKSTLAYAARAIAYWRKNDRDHAVADYNQAAAIDASELRGMATVNAELGAIGQLADQRPRERAEPQESSPPKKEKSIPAPAAVSVSGKWVWSAKCDDGTTAAGTFDLEQSADGAVSGRASGNDGAGSISGQRQGNNIIGSRSYSMHSTSIVLTLSGGRLRAVEHSASHGICRYDATRS